MKLETKFDIGDYVYFMYHNAVVHAEIKQIKVSVYSSEKSPTILYETSFYTNFSTIIQKEEVSEEEAFESKENLIKSL